MPRLTPRGLCLACAGVVLLAVAAGSGLRALAWAGGALLGLVLVAVAIAWATTREARLARFMDTTRVPAGASAQVTLRLAWRSAGLGGYAVVKDQSPAQLLGATTAALPSHWGSKRATFTYRVTAAMRGRYSIGPAQWTTADGCRLALTRRRLGGHALLTVTPTVHRLDGRTEASGAGLSGEATQQSSLLGQDDALVREYRPRDEIRRIHWPSTARTGTLMVRREEHAWEPTALVLLDTRAGCFEGRGPSSSFEWAVSAAASVGVHLLDHGYSIRLADAQAVVPPVSDGSAREGLLDWLTDVSTDEHEHLGVLSVTRSDRGQLMVAVLGRLSEADAVALTTHRPDGRLCRAIVLHSPPPGSDGDPADILRAHGWQVSTAAAEQTIAAAWRELEGTVAQ